MSWGYGKGDGLQWREAMEEEDVFVIGKYKTEDEGRVIAICFNEEEALLVSKAPQLLHCLKVIIDHADGDERLIGSLHLDIAQELVDEVEKYG